MMKRFMANVRRPATIACVWAALGAAPGLAVARNAQFPSEPACAVAAPASSIYASQERVARTARGPIGYYRFGHGSPLLLVTGFRATIAEWDSAFLAALAQHHDVIVFDNRGVGRSIPDATSFTVQDMARDTTALIRTLHLDRPAVLGWSMGGAIVQQLAIDDPDLVGRIVLMSTLAPGAVGAPVRPGVMATLSGGSSATFETIIGALFPEPDVTKAVRCFREEMYRPPGYQASKFPTAVAAGQSALLSAWAADDAAAASLRKVRIPALVMAGVEDAVVPVRNAEALQRLLPDAQLLTVDNAGHAMMYQYAAPLAREITAFVGR